MLRKRVAVAMSGGVDSSVAAYLLKTNGFDVHGIYMRTWHSGDELNPIADCPWRKDVDDASNVAEQIGITFEVVNMIKNYEKFVVSELINGYRAGITPNPDILCNQFIKFGVLREYIEQNGYDYLATGHYCRKIQNIDGSFEILSGIDKNKDQSYFLAKLQQNQLAKILFPIGGITKTQVREIAQQAQLINANKKDSQGICFLGKVKIQDFLLHYIPKMAGNIVDPAGTILGKHSGLCNFTIGQRHGINIPSNTDNKHYVVIGKNVENNELIIEIEKEDSKFLYINKINLRNVTFLNKKIENNSTILCIPRYRDPKQKAKIEIFEHDGTISSTLTFDKPQRALAKGQVSAFYKDNILLGSGIYC